MEAAQHAVRSLPSKLRWRPYANGNTLKTKKSKRDDEQQQEQQQQSPPQQQQQQQYVKQLLSNPHDVNVQALAHKVRRTKQADAAGLTLQWEQAETTKSMSLGGHPPSHPRRRHFRPDLDSNMSSPSQPLSADYRNQHQHDATSSLPSPPSRSPIFSTLAHLGSRVDESGLGGRFKASVPALNGHDFLQHGIELPVIEANSSHRTALLALLEHHRMNQVLDAKQAAALALTSVPAPSSSNLSPIAASSMFGQPPTSGTNTVECDSNGLLQRKIDASEFMGIVNIQDLLASCGYRDLDEGSSLRKTASGAFVSPATTDASSPHSSPVHGMVDDMSRISLPSSLSSSSPSLVDMFDLILTQAPGVLAEGNSRQVLNQNGYSQLFPFPFSQDAPLYPNTSPTLSTASTVTASFSEIIHDIASPFLRLSPSVDSWVGSSGSSLSGSNDNPATWSSLFPKSPETNDVSAFKPQAMDRSTDTDPLFGDGLARENHDSSLFGRVSSSPSSSTTHLGLTQEELDPEWLSYLDDASPILEPTQQLQQPRATSTELLSDQKAVEATSFEDAAGSPSSLLNPAATASSTSSSLQTAGSLFGGWANGHLRNSAMSPTGHRTVVSNSMTAAGGSGKMVRHLKGNGGVVQQRSHMHTRALPRRTTTGSSLVSNFQSEPEIKKEPTPTISMNKGAVMVPGTKGINNNAGGDEGVGRLTSMFRSLWK